MTPRPLDTAPTAWSQYGAILDRMSGEARLRAALDMSESVRLIRLAGIRAANPDWSQDQVVRRFISEEYGVEHLDGA
jgi:hypothetical protein